AHECVHTARQVALIAEVERRRLYAPAGHPSMYAYCVGELHLSEDAAYKRIRVARSARRFPQVVAALASGTVHLSGLTMLARAFTSETVDELLAAASHKSKAEIAQLMAARFPRQDLPARVHVLSPEAAPTHQVEASPIERPTTPQVLANAESE